MTERKPPDLSFTSWIDRQISEAAERGAFDDLPGAGKPLPRRSDADAGQAWLRDYLRREGVAAEELLPTPLRLRKEIERLTETVRELRSEQEVRDVAADLNRRIIQWRRIPEGPPVYVPLVNADLLVSRWRDGQASPLPSPPPLPSPAPLPSPPPAPSPPPRRWRRLRPRTPLNNRVLWPSRLSAWWPCCGPGRVIFAVWPAGQWSRRSRGVAEGSGPGGAGALPGWSGQDPGTVLAGQPVPQHGPQVDRGAPGAQPGVVLGSADVAQPDPAAVLGGGPGDDPLDR